MTRRLTVAHLSALDLPPPDFIEAAARAGFDGVGLRLIQVTADTAGYPLMDDQALLRATKRASRDTGVEVSDIEFVKITPETDPHTLAPFFDAGAELGARHAIMAPYDDDLSRLADRLGAMSDLARNRGIGVVLEFFPWTSVPDLATCWNVVQQAGSAVGILADSLHFDRSGSSRELLRSLPPERLPFAHLCDARVQSAYTTQELLETARAERLAPGDGQIDLAGFLTGLPAGTPLGLEVPMLARTARDGADRVLAHLYRSTVDLLASLGDA
ncbi:MAG: sugar phosphate isomerase/epimerase [Rhodobacteraceae bacterium]|nr:sugar phosphate isomerase/epimerase [Paracoccaceae bacterium]